MLLWGANSFAQPQIYQLPTDPAWSVLNHNFYHTGLSPHTGNPDAWNSIRSYTADDHVFPSPSLGITDDNENLEVVWDSCSDKSYAINGEDDIILSLKPDTIYVVQGGTLGYWLYVTNSTSELKTFYYATNINLPDNSIYPHPPNLLFAYGPLTVSGNTTDSAHIVHNVPSIGPIGDYTYNAFIGWPGDLWDEAHFNFTVSAQNFSFAIIADPHIGEGGSNTYFKFGTIVRKINSIRTQHNILFVFIVGDITNACDPAEFDEAIDTLNQLNSAICWIPLIGNHDIAYGIYGFNGSGEIFNSKFQSHYDSLANYPPIQNWKKQTPTSPDYLQNFSFDYYIWERCYHFICLDWVARWGWGDVAVKGGTYDWYENDLKQASKGHRNIFLFAHHPCICGPWGGFYLPSEYNDVTRCLYEDSSSIGAWFNGHLHRDFMYDIDYPCSQPNSYACQGVSIEACKDSTYGIAKLVQISHDGSILVGNIYGEELTKELPFVDITLSRNHATELVNIQSVKDTQLISTGYALFQNYPNPVTKKTSITYFLAAPSYITLKVYDLSGRPIKALIEGQQNEGTYTVIWDCRAANGERVPQGIYFYCLTVGDFTEGKKMLVIE